jgi:hypothetical protein
MRSSFGCGYAGLRSLRLGGEVSERKIYRRVAENAEEAQRRFLNKDTAN